MQNKYEILDAYFGYSQFRQGQEEVIDAVLAGQDAVGIMPTGAGKSLCFQVPALLLDGVTLVVSPLISLMKDQVNALTQAGVAAAYINSSLTQRQQSMVLENAAAGKYKLIYVAPERLLVPEFLEFATSHSITFVAVDEAHCVSQWGQDFRPSYLRIREFLGCLPTRPVVGAFTATATRQVRDDIVAMLALHSPALVSTGFDRENLYFEIQSPRSKFGAVEGYLEGQRDKSGIIYCLTRKEVESVCDKLTAVGYSATRYHAGLPDEERRQNQENFQSDARRIMVATNAFGMGIDKSNVSFVIHYNMPKNMESYYQEAGRAGRDGSPAECLLLYSGQDVMTNQFFIEKNRDNDELDGEALQRVMALDRERLRTMTFYCHTQDCLRQYILGYFGEKSSGQCGNCYNCLHQSDKADITVEAQKILSCVKRMGQRYGVGLLIGTLRGSREDRLLTLGMDQLSTYGIMAELSEKRVREMVQFLAARGYLEITNEQYPIVRLTASAKDILFGGEKIAMHLPRETGAAAKKSRYAKTASLSNPRLFSKLQGLRSTLAKAQSVPAYVIFPDSALREMSETKPQNDTEFLAITGVGQAKLQRYGAAFLEMIRSDDDDEADQPGAPEPETPLALEEETDWTSDQDTQLSFDYAQGLTVKAMAEKYGRPRTAILQRLKLLAGDDDF